MNYLLISYPHLIVSKWQAYTLHFLPSPYHFLYTRFDYATKITGTSKSLVTAIKQRITQINASAFSVKQMQYVLL